MLESLTSMRFAAALCVVFHHEAVISGNLIFFNFMGGVGALGVSFFFILSGFVLMWSFDDRLGYLAFVGRRLARIYPLHLACLLLALLFYARTGVVLGGRLGTVIGTVANLFLLQDWVPLHEHIRQSWNGVSWSLSCELFFYLTAPVLFPLLLDIPKFGLAKVIAVSWLALLAAAVAAQAAHCAWLLDVLAYYPLPRLGEFLLGAVGAQWIKSGSRLLSIRASVALMLITVLSYWFFVPAPWQCAEMLNVLFIPGAFLLILAAAGSELDSPTSWMRQPFLVRLGDASFALYMIHSMMLSGYIMLIEDYCGGPFLRPDWFETLLLLLFTAAAVLASLAVHAWFEHPLRILLLKRRRRPGKVSHLQSNNALF